MSLNHIVSSLNAINVIPRIIVDFKLNVLRSLWRWCRLVFDDGNILTTLDVPKLNDNAFDRNLVFCMIPRHLVVTIGIRLRRYLNPVLVFPGFPTTHGNQIQIHLKCCDESSNFHLLEILMSILKIDVRDSVTLIVCHGLVTIYVDFCI